MSSKTGGVWYVLATRNAKKEILVQYILTTKTTGEWIARLKGQVPCARVNDPASGLRDPFVHERQMIVETVHPDFGRIRHVAGPVKLAGARKKNPRRAPKLGEHTEQIPKEWLGMQGEEIGELKRKGAV